MGTDVATMSPDCLDEPTLDRLRAGTLGDEDSARALTHLTTCLDCARRAGSVAPTADPPPPRSSPPEPTDRLPRGTSVGRYVVLDRIGSGGMGDVYSAYDPELERKVALKVIRAAPSGDDVAQPARLLREAQALARLSHPNVVAVHDVGSLPDGRIFLTVELVAGSTLRQWMKKSKRSWRAVLDAHLSAGRGLAAARG